MDPTLTDEADGLRTPSELFKARRDAGNAAPLLEAVRGLKSAPIKSVLITVQTTEDPLILWVAHATAQAHGIPPCLRSPKRYGTSDQLAYITWLADALWLAKNHPGHAPKFTRWRNLFVYTPGSAQWHKTALWIYRNGRKTGRRLSFGLALTDAQLQPLLSMQSNKTRSNRKLLRKLPDHRERIYLAALNHPDLSGKFTPEQVADRRAELLRLFILASKSKPLTAKYHQLLTGTKIHPQVLTNQLTAIHAATGIAI